ncbi:MAG: hypothetical protein JO319_02880 [Acidobacteriaceae bacterium]|nr:hypothetical protein [Acidobacteriaceae bacterium]
MMRPLLGTVMLFTCLGALSGRPQAQNGGPDHVPPRRSSQIADGFGINSDMPRDPFIPWNRWWWTRMFDAGINFIRIGQYENSSDYTSWEWVERKRGEYSLEPAVDDYVNSLIENGVHIELQLLYGNPLYTSPAGRVPETIIPEPGGFHNPDRSIYSVFWPPVTAPQIEAFTRYVTWMVKHFQGRIEYYEIWNEPNIDYWNPVASPEDYGKLFNAAAAAVHNADPRAKVVFGGLAGAALPYAKRALEACNCAGSIDVFAYHNYPGYGHNLNPEAPSKEGDTNPSSKPLRDMVRAYPGIRKDMVFWDDEFNDGIPSWAGCDESVQAKYIPRGLIMEWAEGIRTFVWLIVGAADGNEFDDFGMLRGLRYRSDDFEPRKAFLALQSTYALFSDTRLDPSISVESRSAAATRPRTYAFKSAKDKAIIAYWLPIRSEPGVEPSETITLRINGSGIRHPVLVDVTSGRRQSVAWAPGTKDTLEKLPLSDTVRAITDETYFDWPVLPEAPSDLTVKTENGKARLSWAVHGGGNVGLISVERRNGYGGSWQQIAKLAGDAIAFTDPSAAGGAEVFYRVQAGNSAGLSAHSNIATPK